MSNKEFILGILLIIGLTIGFLKWAFMGVNYHTPLFDDIYIHSEVTK